MKSSRTAFILNAHLPYVRHPEFERFLEEDWYYEAVSETYLPLIRMLNSIADDDVRVKIVISLSPTLVTMMGDDLLKERTMRYLTEHQELGEKEVERTKREQPEFAEMAQYYLSRYQQDIADYEAYDRNLVGAFRRLEDRGVIQIITSSATHCYLPIYQEYPSAIRAQINMGLQTHYDNFGRISRGFWLPECGYFPGLEKYFEHKGVQWFQTAAESVLLSPDKITYGTSRPFRCPDGVVAFPRDYELTSLVWDAKTGYPCDKRYREFYRDIGYDLPMDYIGSYVDPSGQRIFTGFKYCAITGSNVKDAYNLAMGKELASQHAKNFLYIINDKARRFRSLSGVEPFFTLAFDCELFGHWWFEGIEWLEDVLRAAASDPDGTDICTPTDFLFTRPELQTARPAFSSWGKGGFSSTWVNGATSAIYPHIFEAIQRMGELAERFPEQTSLKQRFLNQAAREVLLAMASDWPFIIYNKTDATYAEKRVYGHLKNFNVVYSNMCKNVVNTEWLVKSERQDAIFPDIDYNIFHF